jgi:hypothetical protein
MLTEFWLENVKGKRPLRRLRLRRKYNIKMDLKETEFEGLDWINMAQDSGRWRVIVQTVIKFRVL